MTVAASVGIANSAPKAATYSHWLRTERYVAVNETIPMQDRRDSHQGREGRNRRETTCDGMPTAGSSNSQEEVSATQIHRAEDHRRHRRLDCPREQPFGIRRPRDKHGERQQQEWNDRGGDRPGGYQNAIFTGRRSHHNRRCYLRIVTEVSEDSVRCKGLVR
jgi:hypothetical protein